MTEEGPTANATQLELPLRQPVAAPGPPTSGDWRLDARTRAIGRQGVAAARARLARPAGSGTRGPDRGAGGRTGPVGPAAEAGGRRGRAA